MQIRLGLLPAVIFFSIFSPVYAANFTFTFGQPTQCDNFPVSWSGGTPPYSLVLTPIFGTPRTFSIPSDSFNNGKGSFEAVIPFPENQTFIATMGDASGFGTGGTTSVIKVGPQVGSTSCNTTDPGVDFFFNLNTALTQCRPYTIDGYEKAVQPVTVLGVIPGGQTFVIQPPTGPASFDWDADVAAGTSIVFIMTDSRGRQGGSSDVKTVGISDDKTCLSSNSPASVSLVPSASSSGSPSSTSSGGPSGTSSSDTTPTGSSKPGTGVIIAAICASLLGIGAIIGLVVFFLRRRKNRGPYFDGYGRGHSHAVDLGADPFHSSHEDHSSPAPAPISPYPFTAAASSSHGNSPSSHNLLHHDIQSQSNYSDTYPPMQNAYPASQPPSRRYTGASSQLESLTHGSSSGGDGTETWQSPSITSSARNKAAMAGVATYKAPPRFILHTDLEEMQPPQEEDEIIELPPQYSERRAPIAGLTSEPPRPPISGKPPLVPDNDGPSGSGPSSLPYR